MIFNSDEFIASIPPLMVSAEPLDPFTSISIKEEVINTITQYEPRVRIIAVNVKANFEKNSFDVELRYQIVGLPPVETIEFVLQRPE